MILFGTAEHLRVRRCPFFAKKNATAGSPQTARHGMRYIIFILLPVPAQGVLPAVG